jgi:hypothetical protein
MRYLLQLARETTARVLPPPLQATWMPRLSPVVEEQVVEWPAESGTRQPAAPFADRDVRRTPAGDGMDRTPPGDFPADEIFSPGPMTRSPIESFSATNRMFQPTVTSPPENSGAATEHGSHKASADDGVAESRYRIWSAPEASAYENISPPTPDPCAACQVFARP